MEPTKENSNSFRKVNSSSPVAGASWLFHRAAREGDAGALEHLLAQVDCNEPDWEHGGRLALHEAVRGGHVTAVGALLSEQRVHRSVRNCQGQNALHVALDEWPCNGTLVNTLLKAGCDANAHEMSTGFTPLHLLLRHASKAKTPADQTNVLHLLEAFCDHCDVNSRDSRGRMAIHMSTRVAEDFSQSLIKLLALKRADMNARDDCGETALMMAVDRKLTNTVQTLLECGADVDTKNRYQQTALHYAANRNAEECVDLLLNSNCNPNAADLNGDTALHLAAGKGNRNTVVRLLQCDRIKVDILNIVGKRALEVAKDSGFSAVVEILEKHMIQTGISIEAVDLKDIEDDDITKCKVENERTTRHLTVVINGVLPHEQDNRDAFISVSRLI